jgi:hypothetical protein
MCGLGSRFYDQTMKAWKDRRGKRERNENKKKNADRFREITRQDFLSCSNYNNLSSSFLDFVGFLVSVCYIVVFVVVLTVLHCGMNMN